MSLLDKFKEDSKNGLLYHIGGIVVLGFVLLALFFYVYLPIATSHGTKQQVPDLRGMKEAQVADLLNDQGLRYEIVDSTYAADMPPLAVVLQNPKPNEGVKKNRKVYLTINQVNPPSVKLPNVITKSSKEAKEQLSLMNLVVTDIAEVEWCYKDVVVGLEVNGRFLNEAALKKGFQVKVGEKVKIFVSNGEMDNIDCRDKEYSPH